MNVSLVHFSKNTKHGTPITLHPTRVNDIKISDFFISHSFSSFLKTKLLNCLHVSSSRFDRYLNSVILLRNDFSQDEKVYSVKKGVFTNALSSNVGSALSFSYASLKVSVSFCSFINCTTTSCSSSPVRSAYVSGGSCYFYAADMFIDSCFFCRCKSTGLGAAIYASSPSNVECNISCLCDESCGQASDCPYHTIYSFEILTSNVHDVNSTNQKGVNEWGVYHFGLYPVTIKAKYFLLILSKEAEESAFLLLSLSSSSNTGYLSNFYFSGCKNSNGFFSIWVGNYIFDNTYFCSCSGPICDNKRSPISVSFKNAIFETAYGMSYVSTDSSCKISSIETKIIIKCPIKRETNTRKCITKKVNLPLLAIIIYS